MKCDITAYDGLELVRTTKSFSENVDVQVHVFAGAAEGKIRKFLNDQVHPWQLDSWSKGTLAQFDGIHGPLWIVWLNKGEAQEGSVKFSDFSRMRDLMGSVMVSIARSPQFQAVGLQFHGLSDSIARGALVGTSMAQYKFSSQTPLKIELIPGGVQKKRIEEARGLAQATNLSRRLVDLPANVLHPTSYASGIKKLLSPIPNMTVEVWSTARLKKEKMGLHLGVGQAANEGPCLVHIKYRPMSRKKPIAFVGKGITFDSGGLDVKPANAMRWMKKDMGGSAAVAGLAFYMGTQKVKQPADFYLALAENAIAGDAFRPGDVLTSRSGKTVEIHNTDAEGRLVLADAIDVAVTSKEAPEILVDVATLTGAVKVGLGTAVAGLFSNQDALAKKIEKASFAAGDPLWHLPLYRGYRKKFRSSVADMTNAVDGFGGAINAALFLENFVRDVPWAHLDIYSWVEAAQGPYAQSGGSGQGVQCLVEWISTLSK